jgi:hypothetical protein
VHQLEAPTTLDSMVAAVLEQYRDTLAGFVHARVEALVAELVNAELNGNASPATPPPDRPAPQPAETKLCRTCNEEKPAGAFERGRRQCRQCRRRARERSGGGEEPHPAPTPQRGHRSQRRLDSDRYWTERRRTLIEQARTNGVTTELRDGREYVVLHLQPQFGLPYPSP